MNRTKEFGQSIVSRRLLTILAFAVFSSGCGLQVPSVRSPFYLSSNTTTPIQQSGSHLGADFEPPAGSTIVVQRGETLFSLARRHHVTVDELADANGLETHEVDAGQQLELPLIAQR